VLNSTDCHARLLAYQYALSLLPERSPQLEVFDALELQTCNITRPSSSSSSSTIQATPPSKPPVNSTTAIPSVYVDYAGGSDTNKGSLEQPVKTLLKGLQILRGQGCLGPGRAEGGQLVLRMGVHYLNETLHLTAADSHLTITAFGRPGAFEEVWVSGGRLLQGLQWVKWNNASSLPASIRTSLHPSSPPRPPGGQEPNTYFARIPADITSMPGLATLSPHRRLTRARYPNCDPEMMAGCYAGGDAMLSWRQDMRCVGLAKTVYEDLRDCDNAGLLPNGAPCYNYSAMWVSE